LDEQGNVLVDSLINPELPVAPEVMAQHGLSSQQIKSAPTFAALYPTLQPILENHAKVVYSAQESRVLQAACRDIPNAPFSFGGHELDREYAYYWGQLNEARDACIMQSLEAASQQQQVPVQPGLVGQCRMILGVLHAMADWLAATALPEDDLTEPEDDTDAPNWYVSRY
jgi:hypothetical protein